MPAAVDPREFSQLSSAMKSGDQMARDHLWALIYPDLLRIAQRQMSHGRSAELLQPTALVHECYLRLSDTSDPAWEDKPHFLATAAGVMRHILVDQARAGGAGKRGGQHRRVTMEDAEGFTDNHSADILALEEALGELSQRNPRQERIVELRAFAGMDVHQTARALGVSPRTVKADWAAARLWLRRRLRDT
ncbi:MAG: ECF-type sigma factor [Planctomycetota bacterium]|jgi:RNA polymerase sigma factor (TIGR02999 family)